MMTIVIQVIAEMRIKRGWASPISVSNAEWVAHFFLAMPNKVNLDFSQQIHKQYEKKNKKNKQYEH